MISLGVEDHFDSYKIKYFFSREGFFCFKKLILLTSGQVINILILFLLRCFNELVILVLYIKKRMLIG